MAPEIKIELLKPAQSAPQPQPKPSVQAPAQAQNATATNPVSSGSGSASANYSASADISMSASATPTAAQIASDFSDDTDVFTQTAEEEKETKKAYDPNTPIWLQASAYEQDDEKSAENITEEDISNALNKIVQHELSEKGKADTLYYSDKYGQGFTHNGKVVNGSCTEGGMKKAILGGSKYITVTDSQGVTKSGVEAMADSYDSVLDLYTQEQFKKVLEEYGSGTFVNNCNFLKHTKEIREKYGIDIKLVETKNADGSKAVQGIQNRTFEISLVDDNGNIIEDAEGNKSTILFGDWVIPDGCAQGAEFDFISVIDEAGYDCISKADFINNEAFASNPEFQDENGNYDPGKAFANVLGQLENEYNNLKAGKTSSIMQASDQTINEATYTGCTFTWWSAGGSGQYYGKSGLDPSLLGGVSSYLEKAFDANNDGVLSEEEQANMANSLANEKEPTEEEAKTRAKIASDDQDNFDNTSSGVAQTASVEFTNREFYQLQGVVEDGLAQNANADVEDIIRDYAKSNGLDEEQYVDIYLGRLKDTKATAA